jgi:GTPase SAR1 family protein
MISQSMYDTPGGSWNYLLVFFSRESFTNLSRWLADARTLASPHLVVVLVGNKSDREEEREVEWAEASRWAAENGTSSSLRFDKITHI